MRFMGIGLIAALAVTGSAQAAMLTPGEIVTRHNAAVAKGDVDAIMQDYAEDAVVLEAGKSFQGKAAIRGLMQGMFPARAPGAPPSGAATMTITKKGEEGQVGYFMWELGPVKGTDELLVKDGKIAVQAVFISGAAAPR